MKKTLALSMRARVAACLIAALAPAGSALAQVDGKIMTIPDNRVLAGQLKWKASGKMYEIRQASGVIMTMPLDKIGAVKMTKPPAALDGLVRSVQSGAAGAAVPGLEQIVKDYEMLEYDLVAGRWLAEAYLKTARPDDAIRICDQVSQFRPKSALPLDFVRVYWDALLAARQYPKLEEQLGGVIAEGSRDVAAVAQNKRGDMKMEKKEFKDALVDGYLRTVVLFEDAKAAQPEALYKAAQCFDQLGQATYAERMRKKLLAQFPQDSYAEKLKSGN
jgi:hypothetical protein